MLRLKTAKDEIDTNGFAIREGILSSDENARLLRAIERIDQEGTVRRRGGVFAVRNLLDVSPEVRELAHSSKLRVLVEPILGINFTPVRGILFDKIADANWKVPWHQDVTIAVEERVEAEDFGPWSMKAGVLHVQAPARVLESMISVRLHLDSCMEANGALRVIPGSHRRGRIPEEAIASMREKSPERICEVRVGGALLMRPLLLHASSASLVPEHRRVIHLDFASAVLPNGMRWFTER
jgi:hypothetical protein